LIGGGGHCKVVIDTIKTAGKFEIAGIIDLKGKIGSEILSYKVVGEDNDLEKYFKSGIRYCFISAGSAGDPKLRTKLYAVAKKIGFTMPNIIHSSAVISPFASLGNGNYVAAGAIINAGSGVANNCIINTGAIVDHDCRIGEGVHIAPGAVLSGGVIIDDFSHIGNGSAIRQNVSIGKNTVIGTGSVVIDSITDNVVAYGNPCKEIRRNEK